MGFISELFAGGTEGVLKGAGDFAKSIREAITGKTIVDPIKQQELLLQAEALENAQEKAILDFQQKMSEAQTAINEKEAQSGSLFVSGWRPGIGWICGCGLFYAFLLKPLLPWTVSVISLAFGSHVTIPVMPEIDMGDLITLLLGMLGLGGLRTFEKVKGVARKK